VGGDQGRRAGMRRCFGTDGVRGRVGRSPITPDFIVRLGYAIGKVLIRSSCRGHPRVLISKDTRLSGYLVESALEAGISASGADVMLSGPLPTSGVAYLTRALRLSAGIMISASHNPYCDNGIKIFGPDGRKLSDEIEEEIERFLERLGELSFGNDPGKAERLEESGGRYVEFCKGTFPQELDLHGAKIVVDCANGAAYQVAPAVFHELGAEAVAINDSPDGKNINEGCGVMDPGGAARAVLETAADLGVVLDGDADRLLVVDRAGKLHDGDALLLALAEDMVAREAPPEGIVGTAMSNLALERRLGEIGIGFERAQVGDRYVAEALERKGWRLGGEPSGHVLLLDRHQTGDGIITALQVLAIMRRTGKPFDALVGHYRPVPQTIRSVAVGDRRVAMESGSLRDAVREEERALGDRGRILVRASGTEEKVRILVEGDIDSGRIDVIAGRIAASLRDASAQ